jgi:imidazole glycerol-phosphate synthase subunit HisH
MLTVVDLGVSNLNSMTSALTYLGVEASVSDDPHDVEHADALILPGVGSFDAAVHQIDTRCLRRSILKMYESGVPILGVCLGMQILFEGSEEGGRAGLGLLEGYAVRLGSSPNAKVPHVGFDAVSFPSGSWLASTAGPSQFYYFTHSYAIRTVEDDVSAGVCDYDGGFVAAIERWPVVGAQFHPEKSQTGGLRFLLAFLERWRESR